jgi:hypothetical protein
MARTFCLIVATAVVFTALVRGDAFAVEDFPINGTYMQNRPCHGDGTDAKPLLVTIQGDEIQYHGGACVMNDRRVEGNRLLVRVTCKGRSGSVLSGDISFTLRNDNNLEMIDQDKNYRVVLYRCPAK